MKPGTRRTAEFYDALSQGGAKRGLFGLASRFDAGKIIDSPSADAHFRQVVRRFLGSTDRVLDVGCGPGAFTAIVAEMAGTVVGVDVSRAWVDAAQVTFRSRGVANASSVLTAGNELPFENESFDAVIMVDVIHHLEHPERMLAEVRRVLTRAGTLLVFEPNKLNPLLTLLCMFDRNEWGFLRPNMGLFTGYRRLLSPGFLVEDIRYSGLLIGPDGPWARRIVDVLTQGVFSPLLRHFAPKIFVAARRQGS
jgi:ubiquinone/menaquinone biosynthesis C-methylase UbiE